MTISRTGPDDGPGSVTALQAVLDLQAVCACKHSRLVHHAGGPCALCEPPARHCKEFRDRRAGQIAAAADRLRAAWTALRPPR